MQQRFCTCGHQILVCYHFTQKGITHSFQTRKSESTHNCPMCGRKLDINKLR